MVRLLVLCPSRGRPGRLKEMLNSFIDTQTCSRIKVFLDNDDPWIEEYHQAIGNKCSFTIDFRKSTTEIMNEAVKLCQHHDYYMVTNDDFIFHTKAWDSLLISAIEQRGGVGIAYGNDLLSGIQLPTTSVISGNIIRAIGWIQLPGLKHLYGDNVWRGIGIKAGCLIHHKGVIIEHKHAFKDRSLLDEGYIRVNSKEMYRHDEKVFMDWMADGMVECVEKVKKLKDEDGNPKS